MTKQAETEFVAAQNGMSVIWWRWRGHMDSEKHMFPAFVQFQSLQVLENATPDEFKKMISTAYGTPIEKVELVQDASQMKYIQRLFDNERQLIPRGS